jgi:hypothetical protein
MYAASVARRLPIHVLSCALVLRFPVFCSAPSEAIFEALVVLIYNFRHPMVFFALKKRLTPSEFKLLLWLTFLC